MTAFRAFPAIVAASTVLLVSPSVARAGHRGHHGGNVTTNTRGDLVRCDQIEVWFDSDSSNRRAAVRGEEKAVIPAGREPLRLVAPKNSGVRVHGEDRRDFEVLACKGAPTEDVLSSVRLDTSNGEVMVAGPSGRDWIGYLLVAAPRDAAIEVEATNGPIGLSGLSGSVTAHAQNGPISIRDSAGEIQADAQNGPIHVTGDSGHVTVRTQNGPIGVSLTGSGWSGAGLDARAVNGPIHVAIPDGYASATLVESLGRSPWSCHGSACSAARRIDDDDRRSMELGSGPALVRVSTENGPVSIASGHDDEDEDD